MTLRLRILVGVAAIIAGCLALAFVAIYGGTGANLRDAIDRDLRGDMSALARQGRGRGADDRYVALRSYVGTQPFRATTRLLFAELPGHPAVSNEPELVARRDAREPRPATAAEARLADAVLSAPAGISTQRFPDVGDLRLLVRVQRGARFGVGEPLGSVARAQGGIARAFVLAGALALGVALLAAAALSFGLTRRLRRMAALADRVDEGDLAPRMGAAGPADEVRHLAVAFDTMLDRLQDAFASQTAFVADASHELRTPLTVIRGQLEVLGRLDAPAAHEVRRVERLVLTEVERMDRMVEDLLILAAPTVRVRPTAVGPLLTELIEAIEATADRRFELGPVAGGTVLADRDRLAQALRNLLRNAVEHTEPGGTVRLSAERAPGVLRLCVDDDGPGIAAAERTRVFERFHRAPGRPRATGGAGLGLAIVQAIAEAHGGRAVAQESVLGGARVVIELAA